MSAPGELALPPHSLEAEQSVIGALLLDNGAWGRVADLLHAEDFYRDDHRRIFRHIAKLIERGAPADVITVTEAIESSEDRGRAGSLAYLTSLAQNTPTAHNARRYAEIVRQRAARRQALSALQDAIERCSGMGEVDLAELVGGLEERLLHVVDRRAPELKQLHEVLAAAMERVDAVYSKGGGLAGLSTGLVDLDRLTGGLEPGNLVIIGARPSMGKTAFALGVAEYVARTAGPVLICSLEMSGQEIGMRQLAAASGVAVPDLRAGRLSDEAWRRLADGLGAVHDLPVHIDDSAAVRPAHVLARARRLQRRHGLRLVVVDYLTLMTGTGDSRDERVGGLAVELKAIARRLNVPVIALAQLNRAVEERPNKRPVLSDLRESGAIEQAADLVLMLYRDEVYNSDIEWRGIAEILIAKQRNGPLGTVYATWLPEAMRFENFAGEIPKPAPVRPVQRGFAPRHAREATDMKARAAGE